ncbi:MAG: threonylcarbamoyl-AMP synthase [Nanoarchaeota archaeon]|nr:threonylcarbamoyl-AMP synthase [Nanoarchaeota archaeon]
METLLLKDKDIEKAASIIKKGGLVAFPTETVYGLGADALNPEAVASIFAAKNRPADNPLIVHVASVDEIEKLVFNIPKKAKILMECFWPGPCSLVFRKKEIIPAITTAGLDTVVIRMPDNEIALELIRKSGVPIAAPSANTSGKPSPTTAAHVMHDMVGRIDAVLEGGCCQKGIESTVIEVSTEVPMVLRLGSLSVEDIEKCIGKVEIATETSEVKSPGMKYRHYAPDAKLILVEGDENAVDEKIKELSLKYKGSMTLKREDVAPEKLFAVLRKIETAIVICPSVPEIGLGKAVMDRLRRAASERIVLE